MVLGAIQRKEGVGVVVPLLFRHHDRLGHVDGGDGAPWRKDTNGRMLPSLVPCAM